MDYDNIIGCLEIAKEQMENAKDRITSLVGMHRSIKYACDDLDGALEEISGILSSLAE